MIIALTLSLASAALHPGDASSAQEARRSLSPVSRLAKGNPKKWVELIQGVQEDGEYSPPAGRLPEPEPSATTPVRYLPRYMRDIPVIVKPAPVYVDEDTVAKESQDRAQAQQQAQQQVPGQQFGGQAGAYSTAPTTPVTSGAITPLPGPLPSAGSPTGSTAIATYGALPSASTGTAAGADGDD